LFWFYYCQEKLSVILKYKHKIDAQQFPLLFVAYLLILICFSFLFKRNRRLFVIFVLIIKKVCINCLLAKLFKLNMKFNWRFIFARPFGLLKTAQLISLFLVLWIFNESDFDAFVAGLFFFICSVSYIGYLLNLHKARSNSSESADNNLAFPFALYDYYIALCGSSIFGAFTLMYCAIMIKRIPKCSCWIEYLIPIFFLSVVTCIFITTAILIRKKAVSSNKGVTKTLILDDVDQTDLPTSENSKQAEVPYYLPSLTANEFKANKEIPAPPSGFI